MIGPGNGSFQRIGDLLALRNGNLFVLYSDEQVYGFMLDASGQPIGGDVVLGVAGPMVELPGNRFAIAGAGNPVIEAPNGYVRVYNSDLTMDPTFGRNGEAPVNLYGRAEVMTGLAVGGDGAIVVRGKTSLQTFGDPPFTRDFLARLQGPRRVPGGVFAGERVVAKAWTAEDQLTPLIQSVL